ncbi:MAG: DNA polymerase III subunit beta [Planctomycetes bacterium]|nr:DNA polymerase III subunit beta [Planctomycetota bacterium]
MRIRGDRAELHEDMTAIAVVVSSQVSKPVYTGILLVAGPEGLDGHATDLEIGARIRAARVQVEEPGSVVVPAGHLISVLRELESDEVLIESIEGRPGVHIAGGGAEFTILGHAAEEFSPLGAPAGGTALTFKTERLLESLRRVSFAAARDQTRYQLHGVCLRHEKGEASLAATDGRRLAFTRLTVRNPGDAQGEAIVPLKAVDALTRMLGKTGEDVKVTIAEAEICFEHDAGAVVSKVVEGRFPEYEGMIPRDVRAVMKAPSAGLLTAVRQAALLASKDTMAVVLRLCEDVLELRTETKDVGQSRIELAVEYRDEPMEIRFNPQFLLDFLRVVDADATVEMHLKDPRAAAVLKAGKDLVYVIMPVAVKTSGAGGE